MKMKKNCSEKSFQNYIKLPNKTKKLKEIFMKVFFLIIHLIFEIFSREVSLIILETFLGDKIFLR